MSFLTAFNMNNFYLKEEVKMGKYNDARRVFLKAVGLGAVSLTLQSCTSSAKQIKDDSSRNKPNFVLILVDDLGWRDVGCYGPASGGF